VLDSAPDGDRVTPRDLQLGYLTELTRLVLKGHTNHFGYYDTEHEEGPSARKNAENLG